MAKLFVGLTTSRYALAAGSAAAGAVNGQAEDPTSLKARMREMAHEAVQVQVRSKFGPTHRENELEKS